MTGKILTASVAQIEQFPDNFMFQLTAEEFANILKRLANSAHSVNP
ncbi:MAG: hypothetical protein FD173_1085 [Gallionellaceae bacterium]|nr:MAG: hypothetical protein FD173_1085 [Gallionellaceae bacterium]